MMPGGVSSYAACEFLAYALGLALAVGLGRRDGRRAADLVEGAVVLVVACLLGSKVFHVLFESRGHPLHNGLRARGIWDVLRDDPWHWARLWDPGRVLYGGALVAVIMMFAWARYRKIQRIGDGFDCAAPGIALGVCIGRVGCFLGGCCYGRPTTVPWAVVFPGDHSSASVPVHPAQLYEATFLAVGFWCALAALRRGPAGGRVFLGFAGAYAVWRFFIEVLRGDDERGAVLSGLVSTSQAISVIVLGIAIALWRRESARAASPHCHPSFTQTWNAGRPVLRRNHT